jgi:hypothetical protein
MEPKRAGLALQVVIVALLAVIAFELANPAKAPVYEPSNSTDYNSSFDFIEKQLNEANAYLQDACRGVHPTNRVTINYCNH